MAAINESKLQDRPAHRLHSASMKMAKSMTGRRPAPVDTGMATMYPMLRNSVMADVSDLGAKLLFVWASCQYGADAPGCVSRPTTSGNSNATPGWMAEGVLTVTDAATDRRQTQT